MQSENFSLRPSADVWCIALSKDGRRVVFGDIDKTLRVWDIRRKQLIAVLKGRIGTTWNVALDYNGSRVISGSDDKTVRVWDVESETCFASLKGHSQDVYAVALSESDLAASGAGDKEIRIWDVRSKKCLARFEGHTEEINSVAFTLDGERVISGAGDPALRVWDLKRQVCSHVFEGHLDQVYVAVPNSDGHLIMSGSDDKTLRLWDVDSGRCLEVFEGHTNDIWAIAWSSDNRFVLSGSDDGTVRIWDLENSECLDQLETKTGGVWSVAWGDDDKTVLAATSSGEIWRWPFQKSKSTIRSSRRRKPYTTAKVLFVGATGVGKSALAHRLVEKKFLPTTSTRGAWVTHFKLKQTISKSDIEREIWIWDFAGQSDYRLINQLFMNETSLAVLVFNPQSDTLFTDICEWDRDLRHIAGQQVKRLLVAGRWDCGGLTVSSRSMKQFMETQGFAGYAETSSLTGAGCARLEELIANNISWETLPRITSTHKFTLLKEEIVRLRERGAMILSVDTLQRELKRRLPRTRFTETELRTVIKLLHGPGMLWHLDFGDYVLFQPECIASYAGALVRKLRNHPNEIGAILEKDFLAGDLDYQNTQRLPSIDEPILLRAMLQTLISRALCFRQPTKTGMMLVFPSYFKRDRAIFEQSPTTFVTYTFIGAVDDIYSTLIVSLQHTQFFKTADLWRSAVDFHTINNKRVGLTMTKESDGKATIGIFFESGVAQDTKVIFIKYVHDHLCSKSSEVTRLRHYICPHCDSPFPDSSFAQSKLLRGFKSVVCVQCERRIPLWDGVEQKFAAPSTKRRVKAMAQHSGQVSDNESKEQILRGYAYVIAGEAGQTYREGNADHGIDGEIEFKDKSGRASAERIYLQLKSGDSHLRTRKGDGAEIFEIKKERWSDYWKRHRYPVMLVIQTSDGQIRWMDVRGYLRNQAGNPTHIVFEGVPFTAQNIEKLRDQILASCEVETNQI